MFKPSSTFLGIFLGITILVILVIVTAETPESFLNMPGMGIVMGGTLAATLVSYPLSIIISTAQSVWVTLSKAEVYDLETRIQQYTQLMGNLKKGNIRDIESNIHTIHSPYLESSLEMVIDGDSQEDIMKVMHWRLQQKRAAEMTHVEVLRSMAAYAPAFGMVGTLLGLVNLLGTMAEGGFDKIGMNMAVALITTFYGLILANMIFKPLAVKLEQTIREEVVLLNTAKEAVSLLCQGKSPSYAREILSRLMDKSKVKI